MTAQPCASSSAAIAGQSSADARSPASAAVDASARCSAIAFMRPPPARAGRACARRPSGSRRARRRCARRGGRGSPPRARSRAQACATARTAFGAPMRCGDLGVARGLAGRDLAQRLPDALLEGGAAHVERQVEADRAAPRRSRPPWRPAPRSRRRRRSGCAFGKRSCRSRTSASGSSPSRMAQTPLSLAGDEDRARASTRRPRSGSRRPSPPARKSVGVMPSTSSEVA